MPLQLPILSSRLFYSLTEAYGAVGDRPSPEAPLAGVQIIVYYHVEGKRTFSYGNWDYYFWNEDSNDTLFLSGPSLDDQVFANLLEQAEASPPPHEVV